MMRALCVLTLASSGALAQNLRASVFQSYSSSVMGSDGQLHRKSRKVVTETSEDGREKTVSETLCKDGNCQQHVTFMGRMPEFMSSMVPQTFYNGMPGMPDISQHMAVMMDRMQQMHHHAKHHMHHYMKSMQHYMPAMQEVHFLAPRGKEGVEVMMPMGIITDAPVAVAAPALTRHAGGYSAPLIILLCLMPLIAACCGIMVFLRKVLFGKAQAREMPLQALGQPLAPEAVAEEGLAMGTQASVGAKWPLRAYLQDLYNRAGAPRTEAELAGVLLGEVYRNAAQKAVAAQV
eukprot:TRINITY_DN3899_c0_g1_i1.p1 TRINITY_DN3899_c0_g1~~TRINITY_DN3899_c0_g1_i1.p1  ORF type:complete len:291 (+),score=61.17 TRINITY_DN3899_c0_g1_i1:1156-2028(+)